MFIGQVLATAVVLAAINVFHGNGKINADEQLMMFASVGAIAFILLAFISNVLSIGFDTIYISVLEDFERNDGSDEKHYFMSNKLKRILLKKGESYQKDNMI